MKVRATLRLRNEKMLAAREALQWTQAKVAEAAEVYKGLISQLECMQYERISEASVARVAHILGLELEDVWPTALRGKSVPHTLTSVGEIEPGHLLAAQARQGRLIAPAPDATAETAELRGAIKAVLATLTMREREIVTLRYGLEDGVALTRWEIAQRFGLSEVRIHQIEAKAIRKLQHPVRMRRLGAEDIWELASMANHAAPEAASAPQEA